MIPAHNLPPLFRMAATPVVAVLATLESDGGRLVLQGAGVASKAAAPSSTDDSQGVSPCQSRRFSGWAGSMATPA